jgi:hypothetical protein
MGIWAQIDLVRNRKNTTVGDKSNKFVSNLSGLDSVEIEIWRPLWPFQMLRLFISGDKLKINGCAHLGNYYLKKKTIPTQLSWSWDRETIAILNPVVVAKRNWAYEHKWIIVSNLKYNKMCDQSKKLVNNLSGLDSSSIKEDDDFALTLGIV